MPASRIEQNPSSRPPQKFLLAVALIAAAVLGLEVALTRVFATVLRYHFAFLVISMALCGLGIGGYAAHLARRKRALSPGALAIAFALSVDVAMLVLMRGVFAYFPEVTPLAIVVILVPFSIAGAFLAEAFARYASWSGRLYAWDLAGAAITAAAIVPIMNRLSAMDTCLLMALLAALAAWCCERTPRLPLSSALVFGVLVANIPLRFIDVPVLPPKIDAQGASLADLGITQPLFTELGTPGHESRIIDTRWNAFARTDVVSESPRKPGQSELDAADMLLVYTNGNVPTNMAKWDGKVSSIGSIARYFPLSDWAFAVAPLGVEKNRPFKDSLFSPRKVLSIGPGGGLDALLSLRHGAKAFYGAEINPSIVGLMNEEKYRAFNGGIYQRPEVHVQTAEGRAFVRERVRAGEKFSLVYSALTKTATAAQGMALLESFVYTTDAFEDYWQALDDDGQITIVLDNAVLVARFFTTALNVMQKHGISSREACRHIAIVNDAHPGPYQFSIVIQKSPLSKAQCDSMFAKARFQRGLLPIWIPDQAGDNNYGSYTQVADGTMTPADFAGEFRKLEPPVDITPRPDDRPFVLDLALGTPPILQNLGIALCILMVAALLFLGWGLKKDLSSPLRVSDALFAAYFVALGVGFMLVEIPLIQKLVLPLGYPTLSLTVILFALLLGGGAGAAISQKFDGKTLVFYGALCTSLVCVATLMLTTFLPKLDAMLLGLPLEARCGAVALLLFPLGVLLGTPFPSGIRLFARQRADLVPLIWGLNGVASVFGSFLSAFGARTYGLREMLLFGAAIYAVAAVLLLVAARNATAAPFLGSAAVENET